MVMNMNPLKMSSNMALKGDAAVTPIAISVSGTIPNFAKIASLGLVLGKQRAPKTSFINSMNVMTSGSGDVYRISSRKPCVCCCWHWWCLELALINAMEVMTLAAHGSAASPPGSRAPLRSLSRTR